MNSRTQDIGKACRLILLCFGENLLCFLEMEPVKIVL